MAEPEVDRYGNVRLSFDRRPPVTGERLHLTNEGQVRLPRVGPGVAVTCA